LRNRIIHHASNEIEKNTNNTQLITTLKSIKDLTIIESDNTIDFTIDKKDLLLVFCDTISSFLNDLYFEG